jgi:hypothetical protein
MYRTKIFVLLLFVPVTLFGWASFRLSGHGAESREVLKSFSEFTGFSDPAFVSEARFIRHRSVSGFYSIYDAGPEVRDIFQSTFVWTAPDYVSGTPSRADIEP